MKLSDDESALYAELAVQIAIRMGDVVFDRRPPQYAARADRFDIKGRVIEHGSMSDFEAGCRVLQSLKAARPLDWDETPLEDDTAWAHWFRVEFDVPGLREHLRGALPNSAPTLSEVIETFLGLTTDYVCRVSVFRDAFAVPPDFERAFDLFERCGYVERVDGMVTWTDKIAPQMQARYHWDEHAEVRETMAESEIAAMSMTLPPDILEKVSAGRAVDVDVLSLMIAKHWYYGRWHQTPLDEADERITLRGGAIGRAQALAKKLRKPRVGWLDLLKFAFTGRLP